MTHVSPFGCQLWLEPDDSPQRIDALVQQAAGAGLGALRLFLNWPWMERQSGIFEFAIYDAAFDAAQRHGLGIKATLMPNSSPWHAGTAGVLQAFTGFLDQAQRDAASTYIATCVQRWRAHPALTQWLLWNEPHGGGKDHLDANLPTWRAFLTERYAGNLAALNQRWLTGFASFEAIPWPENIPHPEHRGGVFGPNRAEYDELEWRARRVASQVAWVAAEVRRHDQRTELCHNPIFIIEHKGGGGTDLRALATSVQRIGASFHPTFWAPQQQRVDYPGLIAAGVRALAAQVAPLPIELTEVTCGGTLHTGNRPSAVGGPEVAGWYLAALAAGAETVTGWTLNARCQDGEAGEFALLNQQDAPSPRSRALAQLAQVLRTITPLTGPWRRADAHVHLVLDRRAQMVELLDARGGAERPGRGMNDSSRGQGLVAQRFMELGLLADCHAISDLPSGPLRPGGVVIASQVVAWEEPELARLLAYADAGGTLVIDAMCGRKDFLGRLHKPWPLGSERLGLRCDELEACVDDHALTLHGHAAGHAVLLRSRVTVDVAWRAWPELRFSDGEAAVLERTYGAGRIVYVRFPLGPSLLREPDHDLGVRHILARLSDGLARPVRPVAGQRGVIALPIACANGELVAVISPTWLSANGSVVRLASDAGGWRDLVTGNDAVQTDVGEVQLSVAEGIALLWRRQT